MLLVDLERADASNDINGGTSESHDLRSLTFDENHKVNVHLDMMAWDMFVIVFGMNCAQACCAGQHF
jgi:hypothetical protein